MALLKRPEGRPDLATFIGLALAAAAILGGLLLEGGTLSDIAQFTAALIVLGGTAGAVMVTTPRYLLLSALKQLPAVFWQREEPVGAAIRQIQIFAVKARRSGLISLDADVDSIKDRFLRKALMLAIDGVDLKEVRRMMEVEILAAEQHGEAEAKVFESAGGYAPTVGILGAVLGLIQVMKHLEDLEAVGHGVAVAFVATVYGVGFANLFLLPAANKLKARLRRDIHIKELALEGVVAIAEGVHPRMIESRLEPFKQALGEPTVKQPRQSRVKARAAA
jgi:chemotaxis protein MotA